MKVQTKHEFFHKGVDEQKTPDIIIDMRRVDISIIKNKWTNEQKKEMKEWLQICKKSLDKFINICESA